MFALRTKGTEADEPVGAHNFPNMSRFASGSVFAEPSGVPGALFDLRVGVNVQIETVSVFAPPKFGEKITLRHFAHVVLMQKFTVISFLTQTTQPMLAHNAEN